MDFLNRHLNKLMKGKLRHNNSNSKLDMFRVAALPGIRLPRPLSNSSRVPGTLAGNTQTHFTVLHLFIHFRLKFNFAPTTPSGWGVRRNSGNLDFAVFHSQLSFLVQISFFPDPTTPRGVVPLTPKFDTIPLYGCRKSISIISIRSPC